MKNTQHIRKTRMKTYSTREAMKIASKNGWILVRTNGDHYLYKHPDHAKMLTLNKNMNKMVFQRLIKEFDLNLNV
jgi:predicted RNA binding protein YcfA (HicA-like mRNA interferase family)